ncbi:FAD-dependent oxidoreductase [Streptomyces axinellae]|uniref:NADPH-dependent 2,4-dienoyl-CoA reductase n=1 Tax=Streptomyces axinellae TaxID=552788 RepID=A0ABP6CEU6_9ACTN
MLANVLRPGAIGTLTLPHRVIMGAMHLNLEVTGDRGAALAAFYAERARAGAALIVTGGIAVSPAGAGGPGYAVLGDSTDEAALSAAVRAVHGHGALIALQLFHAGRYALPGRSDGPPLAPSPVHSRFSRSTPRELTGDEIDATVRDFASGARTARELGFDAVEVMGSEGYLVNQFTAPLTNRRDDGWGGDSERRRRFPVAVTRAVRAAVGPGFPVLFRMSGADLVEGGTPAEDLDPLAVALAGAGADALAVGVGWHESPVPTVQAQVAPGAWAGAAVNVKRALREAGRGALPVIASHRFNRLAQAEKVLAGGEVDFVAMARPFLADPEIVAKSASGRAEAVNLCVACNQACVDRSFGTQRVSCLVNPRAGHEREFPTGPAAGTGRTGKRPARYAVLGAGIAGLEAARALAALGGHVEVYEATAEPGGQFRMAAQAPGKADFAATIRHHVRELRERGAVLHLGHRVVPADIPALSGLDGVVLATGVLPARPVLRGAALPHVLGYHEAFADPWALGPRVAVLGGGGIAVDLAHLLVTGRDPRPAPVSAPAPERQARPRRAAAREVTLLRRGRRIGEGIGPSTRWVVMGELRAAGVRMLTGVTYREITPGGVVLADSGGERLVPADHVVLAVGQRPVADLLGPLRAAGVPCAVAGGAAGTQGLDAVRATAEGLRAAHRLARATAG